MSNELYDRIDTFFSKHTNILYTTEDIMKNLDLDSYNKTIKVIKLLRKHKKIKAYRRFNSNMKKYYYIRINDNFITNAN